MTTDTSRIIEHDGFSLSFRVCPAVNYALNHCHVPVVDDLVITHHGPGPSVSSELLFDIPGYGSPWRRHLGPLASGESVRVGPVPLELRYETLEGLEGRRYATLVVELNGRRVHTEEIAVLGFYEWSLHPNARKSLACFVQPSHPLVYEIVADAETTLELTRDAPPLDRVLGGTVADAADVILEALYNALGGQYSIRYGREAHSYELESQVVRPPHRLLVNPRRKAGTGTCIDLALLVASCLENLRLQPLVIVVRQEEPLSMLHAIVGCWKQVGQRFEPVVSDHDVLEKALEQHRIAVVEPTGFTTRWGKKLAYEEAVGKARDQVLSGGLVFALDVAAARQTVTPLQFPTSPGAIGILRRAEEIARREQSGRLETKHLLRALTLHGRDDIKELLRAAGAELTTSSSAAGVAPAVGGMSRRATINYRRCLDDARLVAGDSGVGFVEEEHLLYALLLSQSREVDRYLGSVGTDREQILSLFVSRYLWTADVEQTIYESPRAGSRER